MGRNHRLGGLPGRPEMVQAEVLLPKGEPGGPSPPAHGAGVPRKLCSMLGWGAGTGCGGEGRPGQSSEDEKGLDLLEGQERGQWGRPVSSKVEGGLWRERPASPGQEGVFAGHRVGGRALYGDPSGCVEKGLRGPSREAI